MFHNIFLLKWEIKRKKFEIAVKTLNSELSNLNDSYLKFRNIILLLT